MKKKILMLLTLFASVVTATAENTVSVSSALIPQGKTGSFTIELTNTDTFVAFQMKLTLPDGITFESATKGNRYEESHSLGMSQSGQSITFTLNSGTNEAIKGNSGALITVIVSADADIEVGTKLTATLSEMEFARKDESKINPETLDFDIEITDRIILDENYTWTPLATSVASDLKVIRTINAGVWSSICFPFAMSADKLKAAFGDDYDLEEFTGYEVEKDGDNVVGITMQFTKNTKAAKVNTPYIIKTSRDISEFEVNAKVNPGNTKKSIVIEDDETGEEVEIASMTGTYAAGTIVPENSLFLSENKFYYSAGKTKMKAFRAYFTLNDVLAEVSQAATRVHILIDDESAGITTMHNAQSVKHNEYYNLKGQRVETPAKGIYIKDGKKYVVK